MNIPTDTATEARCFRAQRYAFRDLLAYSQDDFTDFERLRPLLAANTVAEMVAARDCLIKYLACSNDIEQLHSELCQLASAT